MKKLLLRLELASVDVPHSVESSLLFWSPFQIKDFLVKFSFKEEDVACQIIRALLNFTVEATAEAE